jgi:hypothetical protein
MKSTDENKLFGLLNKHTTLRKENNSYRYEMNVCFKSGSVKFYTYFTLFFVYTL